MNKKNIRVASLLLAALALTSCDADPLISDSRWDSTPSGSLPATSTLPPPPSTSTSDVALHSVDHEIYPNSSAARPLTSSTCLELDVYFLEMYNEYGDSLFLKCRTASPESDVTVLIDAGQNADGRDSVAPMLASYAGGELDLAIFTHGHGDHVDGFEKAIGGDPDSLQIKNILDFGYIYSTSNYKTRYEKYRDIYVKEKNTNYCTAADALKNSICPSTYHLAPELTFEVLNTGHYLTNPATVVTNESANNTSLTGVLRYKDFSLFLSGDLDAEDDLLRLNQNLGHVTLMKAGHHGSNTSNSRALLDRLTPEGVVISAAAVKNGGFVDGRANNHPNPAAIANFLRAPSIGDHIYLNMTMGTVHLKVNTFDSSYQIEGLGARRLQYAVDNPASYAEKEKNLILQNTYFYQQVINIKTKKTLKDSVEQLLAK